MVLFTHSEQSVKAYVYFDGKHYCVRCSPVDVFTQGKTLDEAVKNAQEAVSLHLEDEDNHQGLAKHPSLFIVMEAPLKRVA